MVRLCFTICLILLAASCNGKDAEAQESPQPGQSANSDTVAGDQKESEDSPPPDFSAAGLESEAVKSFFESLKQAAAADDKEKIAGMVSYPLTVTIGEKNFEIKSPAEFVSRYNEIMTGGVKQAIKKQRFAKLFSNWQGVCIGDGQVWFSGVEAENPVGGEEFEIKIVTINAEMEK